MNDKAHPLFNPETVDYALPSDPREIDAVLCAARRSYDLHPYFSMRYGVQGSTFARSDVGYLVTLVDKPQDHVDKQVYWLAALLAGRGMPRWLMESQLDFLCDDLCRAVPQRKSLYQKLQHPADQLRAARRAWIAQADFDALIVSFDASSGGWIKNAGGLMGAAVCDECNGLEMAVPSLLSWMLDATRISPQWCAAVTETVAQARRLVASRHAGE